MRSSTHHHHHHHHRPLVKSSPIAIIASEGNHNNSRDVWRRSSFSSSSSEEDYNDDNYIDDDNTTTTTNVLHQISSLHIRNNNNNATYIGSLPTKKEASWTQKKKVKQATHRRQKSLPGAPLLSSMDNKFVFSELPPPMLLTEHVESHLVLTTSAKIMNNDTAATSTVTTQSTRTTPYGSLRESYLEGKFMDGPASYRDKSSGQIHLLNYETKDMRNGGAAAGMLLLPPENQMHKKENDNKPLFLFPGERMHNSGSISSSRTITTAASFTELKTITSASTLSAMMQDATPQLKKRQPSTNDQTGLLLSSNHISSPIINDDNDNETSMLSTSLTGLEVLRTVRPEMLINTSLSLPMLQPALEPPVFLPPPCYRYYDDDDNDDNEEEETVFELDME